MTRFSMLRKAALGTNSPRPIVQRSETNGCQTYAESVSYKVASIKRTYPRMVGDAAPPPRHHSPAQFTAPVLSPGHGDASMQMLVYLLGLVSLVLVACALYMVFA